ncbi:MAG: AAA family ATPase [Candidatus Altiarchaeota archaeon]
MKLVIGLIGEIASGKDTVAEHISKEYGASVYRFSDVLRDVLRRLHLENTRENLQSIGVSIRQAFGVGVLADCIREDMLEDTSDLIVVDGVRYAHEAEMVRSFENNLLLYVTAPENMRYKRAVGRGTRGEKKISFEQFKKAGEGGTEGMIRQIAGQADHTIENTGTVEELCGKTDKIIKTKLV